MKRKDERLLRLAFGELSDDAARAVEAGADAAEKAEIESFRALREGLQHLPTPPPDGLSAERLRAAILGREIKARRSSAPWGGFLLAPLALAAIAAVVVLPRLRPHAEPQIVAKVDRATLGLKAPTFDDHRFVAKVDPKSDYDPEKTIDEVRSQTLPPEERVRSTHQGHRRRQKATRSFENEEQAMDDTYVVVVPQEDPEAPGARVTMVAPRRPEPQTIAAPASTVVEAAPGTEGRTETVVVVSTQRDLETGAPAATEKEAASVLVGG